MKYRWIVLPIAITTIVAGCSVERDEESVVQDEDLNDPEWVGSFTQSLTKGTPGAVNGQKDYCADPANKCASGEGDCNPGECLTGLVCGTDNGPQFGFTVNYDVCVPSHCTNSVQDAAQGETGVNCGGPCGACLVPCVGTPALDKTSKEFCRGCLCARGQGDCDKGQCQEGLICVETASVGPRWGYPTGWDVCLPQHCWDNVQNSGETGVDVGGECSPGTPLNVYFLEYVEGSLNDHHLEIYNPGTAAQNCTVNIYYGGSGTAGSSHVLNAPVAPNGGLFVLCRSNGTVGSPPCNQTSALLQFSGDDAIELVCGGQTQDIIGQIGVDPGTEWGTGNASTYDNTMRRKCTVTTGDKVGSDAFVPSTQWDGFPKNTKDNLGLNHCAG